MVIKSDKTGKARFLGKVQDIRRYHNVKMAESHLMRVIGIL